MEAMNTDTAKIVLVDPTDDELNAAFAEKVAGYEWVACGYDSDKPVRPRFMALLAPGHTPYGWVRFSGELGPSYNRHRTYARWTDSADNVLPWLSKCCPHGWTVEENEFGGVRKFGCAIASEPSWTGWIECADWRFADTFPRAAVIALLRAHGVEVEFRTVNPAK